MKHFQAFKLYGSWLLARAALLQNVILINLSELSVPIYLAGSPISNVTTSRAKVQLGGRCDACLSLFFASPAKYSFRRGRKQETSFYCHIFYFSLYIPPVSTTLNAIKEVSPYICVQWTEQKKKQTSQSITGLTGDNAKRLDGLKNRR